jgi:hypothetical protein
MKAKLKIASPNMADCLAMAQEVPKAKIKSQELVFDSLWD